MNKVRAIIVSANMRAVVHRMERMVDDDKLSEKIRRRAEKDLAKAYEVATRVEKEYLR